MQKFLSNDAKRKAMARLVSDTATRVLNHNVTLERDKDFDPDEYKFRAEGLETERGRLSHLAIDVCPRGVNLHIKFDCPALAPIGANEYSGKWNHYIWPDSDDNADSYRENVILELEYLLGKIQIIDAIRCDRPGPELWAHYMQELRDRNAA